MKKTENSSDVKNDLKTDQVDEDQEDHKSSDDEYEEIEETSKSYKKDPLLNVRFISWFSIFYISILFSLRLMKVMRMT